MRGSSLTRRSQKPDFLQRMGAGIAAEILVVDDERAVRRGVAAILLGAGYVVREAKNGKEALRLFGESKPDLVLLDVMMPKMDGT